MDRTLVTVYYSPMRFAHWKFLLAVFALAAFSQSESRAEIDTAATSAAEEAYKSGKSAEALSLYEKALASAGRDTGASQLAALYFNAGNSAFQAGKLGWAFAYYARAAKLAPFDGDISHNRVLLEAKLGRADRADA